MASLVNRLKSLAASPQGKKAISQAQRQLSKPENQQKLRKMADKLRGRGKH